ncbi:cytochrome P450 [Rhodocollybia butyracea]|uniref:Cytochrome P450 n=1 Tax=Rhodocollybia butyracea TaxID=206335 RepID=A0A9P5P605_9AGAR|nr:cytochrome P450 [Rhodocollybia butyracea]
MVLEFLAPIQRSPQTAVLISAFSLATYLIIKRALGARTKLPLPPGPPSDSIWGNTFDAAFSYRRFELWTQEYGPVFSLRMGILGLGGIRTIVIGRHQAAIDIMEKHGADLSDRPSFIAAGETLSGGMRILLVGTQAGGGTKFKKLRKTIQSHLQPKTTSLYHPVLRQMSRQHLLDIIDEYEHRASDGGSDGTSSSFVSTKHQQHAKRYAAAVVMSLAYGKVPQRYEDPDIQAVNRCLSRIGHAMRPGAWKVDVVPLLKYLPGHMSQLKVWHKEELELFGGKIDEVKAKMNRGEEVPASFGKYLIEHQASLGLSDNETAYLAGSMFGAGSDTSASAISIAVMAAICHPEAQKRVQDELDSVVGRGRPPTFSDQNSLPQTMAFVNEASRWRPVSAGGFPHRATKDIIWQGYVIPKGSTVVANTWSVGRDPDVFPDPETFEPQRWIAIDSAGRAILRDDLKSYPFGFGRRPTPSHSHPIDTYAFTESANAQPLPFNAVFTPRVSVRPEDGEGKGWEILKEAFEGYGM